MKRHHRFLSFLMIGLLASNEAAAERHHRSTATTPKKAAPVDKRELGKTADASDDDDAPAKPVKKKVTTALDDISAVPIKLDEILEAAVGGSPDLAKARSDRSIAEGEAGAAERAQEWHLGGELDYNRQSQADHTDVAPFQTVGDDKITAQLSLGRRLPTGGEVSFQFQVIRDVTEIYVPSELDYNGQQTGDTTTTARKTRFVRHDATDGTTTTDTCGGDIDHICNAQATLGMKLKQPILRGLGSDIALADQHKAEIGFTIATIKAQLAAEDMVKDVIHAYYELQYAAYEVEIRAEALKLAKGQEDLTRQEIRAGVSPKTQLDTVLYEISNREGDLLKAKQALVKQSLDLRRKIGLKIDHHNLVMRPSEPMEIGSEEWDEDETIARAHHANKRLAALEFQRKAANIDVSVAKDQTLPQLDATLSGAILGVGADPGKALNALGGVSGFQVMAGLSFDVELGGGANKGVQAAQGRAKKIDIDRDDMERQIDVDVSNAVSTVNIARKRVEFADTAIVVANENANAEKLNFMANHTNNFQVMQRQTQLIESQLKRGRAIVDWRIAVADLQYLSGMLLEQYGISAITHASK